MSTSGWWVFLAVPVLAGAVWACRAPQPAIEPPAAWARVTVTPSPTATWTPTAVPTLTPTSTPEPGVQGYTVWALEDSSAPHLSELGVVGAAALAGWPSWTWDKLVRLATCESGRRSGAVNVSNPYVLGLVQVYWSTWFPYALQQGLVEASDGTRWADPVTNLRVALAAFLYDLERGYQPWTQWQCKP